MDDREALIAAARSVAERLGVRRLPVTTFRREARISSQRIYRSFESWHALCEAAGLEPNKDHRRVTDEGVFTAMRQAFLATGRICTRAEFLGRTSITGTLLRRRFRTWDGSLAAFRRWAVANAPDFPLMDELDARLGPSRGASVHPPAPAALPSWPAVRGRTSGEVLAFRAMVFAPTTEAGVIALFGMVAAELGYRIEIVTPGFPDCTARRHVGGGRWESVRVEFEFRSRSFRDHGHDPAECDAIVCWEHDWPDCPVEVLALREAIADLPRW